MKPPRLKVGDKIKFRQMKRPFPVVATNKFFTICAYRLTGCLADKKFIYTIVDWAKEVRAPDYWSLGPILDYTNPEDAQRALAQLGDGRMHKKLCKERGKFYRKFVWHEPELQLSRRRSLTLDFDRVIPA